MTHAGMSSVPEKRLIRQLVAVGDFHSNCIIIPGEVVSLQKQLSSFSPGSTNLKGHSVIGVGVGEGGTFLLVKDKCLKDHKDCQWDHLNEWVHHLAVDRRMAKRVLNSHTDIKVHVKCLVGNRFNKHHNLCLLHWASNTASAEVLHSHAEWGRFIFSPLDSSLASGI